LRQSRSSIRSPASASSSVLLVSGTVLRAIKASATVAACRARLGRPAGFPDWPLTQGRPRGLRGAPGVCCFGSGGCGMVSLSN
jgi:hypothetical protein